MKMWLAALAAVGLLVTATGCEGAAEDANAATDPSRIKLPQQIVGLQVGSEKVGAGLDKVKRPYVDSVAVFSLREDDLLRASLQVNRFNSAARPDDAGFRASIVGTIGGSSPLTIRVGDKRVSATTASDQDIYVWFEGDGMFVLAVQNDFPFPRTLLRRMIELDLSL